MRDDRDVLDLFLVYMSLYISYLPKTTRDLKERERCVVAAKKKTFKLLSQSSKFEMICSVT